MKFGENTIDSTTKTSVDGGHNESNWITDHINRVSGVIEGKELPSDMEELFRNFDQYISQDLKSAQLAGPDGIVQYDRDGFKRELERNLYGGATLKDIEKYMSSKVGEEEGDVVKRRDVADFVNARNDRYDIGHIMNMNDKAFKAEMQSRRSMDAQSDFESGSFGTTLSEVKSDIFYNKHRLKELNLGEDDFSVHKEEIGQLEQEIEDLKKFQERLSVEIGHDTNIKNSEIYDYIDQELAYYNENDSKDETGWLADLDDLRKKIQNNNIEDAAIELDNSIDHWQRLIDGSRGFATDSYTYEDEELRKGVAKEGAQEALVEKFGKNYLQEAKKHITELTKYRDALFDKQSEQEKTNENSEPIVEKKLEGKELIKNQIENNANPKAKAIIGDVILFLDDLKKLRGPNNYEAFKENFDEILYRVDIDDFNDAQINENDKIILDPLVRLRNNLDNWNTVTETKIITYQEEVMGYLKYNFGIEKINSDDGEKIDRKKHKVVGREMTSHKFFDGLIKEIVRDGYKFNDKLLKYHEKFVSDKVAEQDKYLKKIKSNGSQEDFNEEYKKVSTWREKYRLANQKAIRYVEVVKYKFSKE